MLARVDELLRRAVAASAEITSAAPAAEALRGLFVSDIDAGRLVQRGPQPLGRTLAFDRPLVELSHAEPQWRLLANAFTLTPAELDILALAIAPEIDLRYERIFGYLHDDVTRRRLTPDLACQLLCASFEERLTARQLFAADANLMRHGIVQLLPDASQPQGSMIGCGLKIDDGIIEFLLGHGDIDPRLAGSRAAEWDSGVAEPATGEAVYAVDQLLRERREDGEPRLRSALVGSDDTLKRAIVRHVARQLERPLLVVDVGRLLQLDMPFGKAALIAARTAHLHRAIMLWMRVDELLASAHKPDDTGQRLEAWLAVVDAFATHGAGGGHCVSIADAGRALSADIAERFVSVHLAAPRAGERQRRWAQRVAQHGIEIESKDVELLAEVFRLDGGAIDRSVDTALAAARRRNAENPQVSTADLLAAARAQILRALPRYATRIDGGFAWDDIVLPPDHVTQLRELCDRVRHRRIVFDEWGFADRLTLGKGVAALFSGPSGTGKTMAAQIIAATLGMDLYRVEIPAVVSKYIGETEKALDQLFREAQGTSVILFFDEADALFGKRSEVKDAHDRYANIEISYLLQAIEQYDGLTILATNLRHNVDEAFVRRLAFSVSFPFPEEGERRRIWEKCWPRQVPLSPDIDTDFLARQFKLTGGNIRNVALASAFAAAADGGRVRMSHVVRSVRRELQKTGKTCVASDFGPYFELLASEAAVS